MAKLRGNLSAAVGIPELGLLRRDLKELGDADAKREFKEANVAVAKMVVDRARARFAMLGKSGVRTGKALRAGRTSSYATVTLDANRVPEAFGVEFGAYRNMLRLRKNTGGRTYIVRKESKRQIEKAIRRIESQTRLRHETVSKRLRDQGATGVKIVGRVRGWNQFREWRGNKEGAGYALFPAIRASADDITEHYAKAMDELSTKYGFTYGRR